MLGMLMFIGTFKYWIVFVAILIEIIFAIFAIKRFFHNAAELPQIFRSWAHDWKSLPNKHWDTILTYTDKDGKKHNVNLFHENT